MRKVKIAQIGMNGNSHGSEIFNTLKKCKEMDLESWYKRPLEQKLVQGALRIISPLL